MTPENLKLPKDISDLMRQGICPTCKRKMKKNNGKPSHTKNATKVCESLLRERFQIRPQRFKVGNKTFEAFASIGTKDGAEKK